MGLAATSIGFDGTCLRVADAICGPNRDDPEQTAQKECAETEASLHGASDIGTMRFPSWTHQPTTGSAEMKTSDVRLFSISSEPCSARGARRPGRVRSGPVPNDGSAGPVATLAGRRYQTVTRARCTRSLQSGTLSPNLDRELVLSVRKW